MSEKDKRRYKRDGWFCAFVAWIALIGDAYGHYVHSEQIRVPCLIVFWAAVTGAIYCYMRLKDQ